MASKPLKVLKKGLAKFTDTIKTRKKELSAKLARAETISSSDKHWIMKETQLTSNVFLTPWSQPQTMSKGLNGWMKMRRQS
jgi:hypothetical protein